MANSITGAALAVLLMNLLAKILGFVREMIIARVFGATSLTDAYVAAYSLPYSIQTILGWALLTATVPLLTKYYVDGKKAEAALVTDYLFNITAVIMAAFCAVCIAVAPLLVSITVPQFDAETTALTVTLMRMIFPITFFACISMVLAGVLNANRSFLAPAFAPGFCSIIIITALLTVSSRYGIYGLAGATVVGFGGYFLLLVVPSLRVGYRWRPRLSFKHRDIRLALATLIPIIIGSSVQQIYYVLNRFFASGLAEGSISWLNYASKLANFPNGVFVAAIAVAVYPAFSEYALKGEFRRLSQSLERGLGMVMLLSIPAAVGLIALRVPIVELLFESGAFKHIDTLQTASALFWYCWGLFPFAAVLVLLRVYYAFGDVRTPIEAALLAIGVNILVSLVSRGTMGHNGLALANSAAALVNMIYFFLRLKKYLPMLAARPYLVSFVRIGLASLAMAGAVLAAVWLLARLGISSAMTVTVVGFIVGIAVYAVLCLAFRFPEAEMVVNKLKAKLGRR